MRDTTRMALAALGLAAALSVAACGSGGPFGGGGIDLRRDEWGIPFVPSDATSFFLGFRNVDRDAADVWIQGYRPDGTPYSGPVQVTLDAFDEHHVSVNSALGGDIPAGGMILVQTPTRTVDVFFSETDLPFDDESAKASQLAPSGALGPFRAGVTATLQTSLIQISNASPVAKVVQVTPFEEPQADPALAPIEHAPVNLAFAPFETRVFDPDGLSGVAGFFGAFLFESSDRFFVGTRESNGELAFDTQVGIEVRLDAVSDSYLTDVGVRFGRETTPTSENVFDFVMLARNDSEETQTVTIQGIFDSGGSPLIPAPRTVILEPHESRVADTLDPLFADVFGDVLLQTGLRFAHVFLDVPAEVDVTFRQFDPVALSYVAALETTPLGHVFEVPDVRPTTPGRVDVTLLMNPSAVPVEVDVTVLVPEPDGFDATPVPQDPVTIPPFGLVPYVLPATPFFDRDLEPVPFVGVRFSSLRAFGVTAVHERRDALERITALSPNIRSNVEDGRN
jgi:hypothetical protein